MIIREYEPSDCKELANMFYNTVHTVNAKDYTKEHSNGNIYLDGQIVIKN